MRQMKEQKIKFTPIPSTAEVKAERDRLAYRRRYLRVLRSTVYALLVVAAVAVLLATLFLPVLQVSGDSMNPTLQDKDIILLVKTGDMKTGDLCGFYWQNKLLLKRHAGRGRRCHRERSDAGRAIRGRAGLGGMRHQVPLSGAGKPLFCAG